MDNRRLTTVLHQLHQLAGGAAAGTLTDGQLLGRFVSRRDEAAFELLVRRHGPLVWGTCRRILAGSHDAEDAFQATFLVLIKKAASLDRTRPLSAWLHRVACRVALRARETAARRRERECAAGRPEACADDAAETRDLRRALDEELAALPDGYRVPLVLCYLEGLTHEEAARLLGWPLGTVKTRVLRGRERLRGRLARRGLDPCGPLPAVPAPPAAPGAVVAVTLAAGLAFAATGSASAGPASAQAVALTEGVLHAMTMSKLKTAAALLLAATFLAAGAGGVTLYARPADPGAAVTVAAPAPEADEPAAKPPEKSDKPPEKADKPPEPAPVGEKLEALWTDLASDDQAKAWRAAFQLAAAPKDATRLLTGRLKPVVVDAERLAKLIRDLDADDFDTRERASTELKNAGEVAVPHLRKALENNPSVEAKRRLQELLERAKGPSPAWVRSARAVAVLEAVGGDDARKLLEEAAKGDTEALPTRAAKAALGRLGKPAEWQAHWDALGGADEAAALRAALAAVAAPKEALPFFKERLAKGLPDSGGALDPKQVEKLIAGLGDVMFEVRQKSTDDLIALGPRVVPLLRKAREGQPDIEIARRLDVILDKIQKMPPPPLGTAGERLTVVLAHLDTAEARELLEVVRNAQVRGAKTAVSPDGRIRVQIDKGRLSMVDAASGKVIWITQFGRDEATCVAFAPDGKTVAAGSDGGMVHLIDAATGKQILTLRGHTAGVVGVSFSPDGKTLKSADSGGTTRAWDVATGREVK
jgi:RNA polymerase sigma factor (sigma-70 family)